MWSSVLCVRVAAELTLLPPPQGSGECVGDWPVDRLAFGPPPPPPCPRLRVQCLHVLTTGLVWKSSSVGSGRRRGGAEEALPPFTPPSLSALPHTSSVSPPLSFLATASLLKRRRGRRGGGGGQGLIGRSAALFFRSRDRRRRRWTGLELWSFSASSKKRGRGRNSYPERPKRGRSNLRLSWAGPGCLV